RFAGAGFPSAGPVPERQRPTAAYPTARPAIRGAPQTRGPAGPPPARGTGAASIRAAGSLPDLASASCLAPAPTDGRPLQSRQAPQMKNAGSIRFLPKHRARTRRMGHRWQEESRSLYCFLLSHAREALIDRIHPPRETAEDVAI